MTTPDHRPRSVTVRFARIRLAGAEDGELPLDFSDSLRRSVVSGQEVQRRDKAWRFGKVSDVPGQPNRLSVRVGFLDSRTSVDWDPEQQDWVEVQVADGQRCPLVIDVSTGLMSYEPGALRVLAAVQALLNAANQGRWRVERVLVPSDWASFRRSVSRIVELRIKVRRPNPNYRGRKRLEDTMEGAHAGTLSMVMRARQEDLEGLDVEEEFTRQLLEHANDGYGEYNARGTEDQDGEEVVRRFDSQAQGAELVDRVDAADDGHAPVTGLSDALSTVAEDALTGEIDDEERDE